MTAHEEVSSPRRPIVFFQPHLRFGGAENQTVLLANRLHEMGYPCVVVLHSREGGLLDALDPGVEVKDLGFSSHVGILFGWIKALRVLRQMRPSMVLVRLWSSIMLVGMLHRFLAPHRIVFFEDLDPRDHANFIRFGRLKQAIIRRIFRRHSESLVANSRHVAEAMIAAYGLTSRPQVIPCGVDPSLVGALAKNGIGLLPTLLDGEIRAVTVGSVIARKGVNEVLRALAQLKRPVQWVLVGDGPLRDELVEHASHFPLVRLTTIAATTNPYPYIAQSDVMVHGARSESFGIVLVESIALGTPVIANAANGPLEIVATLPDAHMSVIDIDDQVAVRGAIAELATGDSSQDLGPYDLNECVASWLAFAGRSAELT